MICRQIAKAVIEGDQWPLALRGIHPGYYTAPFNMLIRDMPGKLIHSIIITNTNLTLTLIYDSCSLSCGMPHDKLQLISIHNFYALCILYLC